MKLPIQPLYVDDQDVLRFKENKIVTYLLENGGIDLNQIAAKGFNVADEEQFAQLIGYSHSGFGDLSYVSDETWYAAREMWDGEEENSLKARVLVLEKQLRDIKKGLKEIIPVVFKIHPSDLE